jgi:hypothetical protein
LPYKLREVWRVVIGYAKQIDLRTDLTARPQILIAAKRYRGKPAPVPVKAGW